MSHWICRWAGLGFSERRSKGSGKIEYLCMTLTPDFGKINSYILSNFDIQQT